MTKDTKPILRVLENGCTYSAKKRKTICPSGPLPYILEESTDSLLPGFAAHAKPNPSYVTVYL